jgi:Cu/Ag efflux protein CusF
MRTHLIAVVTLAALAAAASGCRTTASKGATGGSGAPRAMEGRVENVGAEEGTITLRAGEERHEILVMPETEIRIDDFKGTFEDIKEGQRVRASFEEEGGQTEGIRIEILDKGTGAIERDEQLESADGASSPDAPR